MPSEPVQPPDATSATTAEAELERLRRFLKVSQAALEVAEQKMQTVRDQ
jgi:hypothetical protein